MLLIALSRTCHHELPLGNIMKVIVRGKPKTQIFEGTCNNCDSVLQAEGDELMDLARKSTASLRTNTEVKVGKCLVCGAGVSFRARPLRLK